jgi:hypothetical protein
MSATVTRLAVGLCAALTIACGGRDRAESDAVPPSITPGEVAGTSGERQSITVSGCLTKVEPDGFVLTSIDDAIVRQVTGTAGHHRDDPDSKPEDPNRKAEDERPRNELNPSATQGRYRVAGDAERIAMHLNREVDIRGHVESDNQNETPDTLHVDVIDATGASCGQDQDRGNDRGLMPTQDVPRKLRR